MFCPKCHTDLDDNTKYCKRCGTKLDSIRKKTSWGSFSSSKTFERMNVKNTIEDSEFLNKVESKPEEISLEDHNETHTDQYTYSKNYSNVTKDNNEEHHEQYNYSKTYSKVTQDNNKNHQEQYTYSQAYSNTPAKQITSDEDYKNAFIGINQNLVKSGFSIFAAIFGPFYCLYRKLWTEGIILLIIYIASYRYLSDNVGMLLRITLNIILAFKFNHLYANEVEKRVQNIKRENQDFTSQEILEACKRKGGTVKIGVIFFFIIIYFSCITILLLYNDVKTEVETAKTENNTETQIDYNSNYDQVYQLTYQTPQETEKRSNSANYKHYSYTNENGKCYITIKAHSTGYNETEFLTIMTRPYSNYTHGPIVQEQFNELTWYKKILDNESMYRTYYVLKKDSNSYLYEMEFYSKTEQKEACREPIDTIMKSANMN